MKYSLFAAMALLGVDGSREIKDKLRSSRSFEKVDDLHRSRGPLVGHAECHTSVHRLKQGPVDIDTVLQNNAQTGLKYYDTSFYGHESLYWEE